MKKIRNIIILFSIIALAWGCEELEFGNDFLKKPSGGDVTIDSVYASLATADDALTAAYSTLPYRLPYAWGVGQNVMNQDITEDLTDLCQSYLSWGGVNRFYYSTSYDASLANWNNHTRFHFHKENSWLGIRRAWLFIQNIDRVPDADQETINRMKGEALMIIATHYTELFRSYGGLPWVNKAFSPNDDTNAPRLTAEATMDSIVSICDRAAAFLPWQIEDVSNWHGRFTRAAAKGLKVRVLLFGASPLFNDNQPFREGEASDLKMTWFGGYDQSHWQNVVTACEDFINDLNSNGQFALVNTGNPRDDFKRAYYDRGNGEVLISVRHYYKARNLTFNAQDWGVGKPTQELVEMYPMANGKAITDPTSGFDPNDPYKDRDPRLYETVIVNGDKYRGRTAELWVGGRERKTLNVVRAGTGYILRKFYLDGDNATSKGSVVHWPYLRLPEIFLSYAEALNELNGGPTPKAYEYLNKTRERVGVGPAPAGMTQEEFRNEVLTERAREFCAEEVRWYDLVRWKMPFIQPHGIIITKEDDGSFKYEVTGTAYERLWVNNWDPKWYLGAFPLDEVNKGYGLVQNPGWE